MLFLRLTFGGFLCFDGQQRYDGNDQRNCPRNSRRKVFNPKSVDVPDQQIYDKGPFDALDIGKSVIAIGELHGGNDRQQADEPFGICKKSKHSDADSKEHHGFLCITALHDHEAFCRGQQGRDCCRIGAEYDGGQAQNQIFNKLINKNPFWVFAPAAQS